MFQHLLPSEEGTEKRMVPVHISTSFPSSLRLLHKKTTRMQNFQRVLIVDVDPQIKVFSLVAILGCCIWLLFLIVFQSNGISSCSKLSVGISFVCAADGFLFQARALPYPATDRVPTYSQPEAWCSISAMRFRSLLLM